MSFELSRGYNVLGRAPSRPAFACRSPLRKSSFFVVMQPHEAASDRNSVGRNPPVV